MSTRTMSPPPPPSPTSRGAPASNGKPAFTIGRPKTFRQGHALVINTVEGWGKTTALCYAPNPIILMARGETGYVTLRQAGRVPDIDTLTDANGEPRTIDTWPELLAVLDTLQGSDHETIGLDAAGGFERLCHEHVCARDFKNEWGEKGFGSFQKGYDVSVTDWNAMLAKLERLKLAGKNIVILSHARSRPFKNPMGADYDWYTADCHEKTWNVTSRWSDAVLFGTFLTIIDKERQGKGKGIGGTDRIVYTERRDAFTAKNRYGMPECIDIPNDPTQVWSTIWSYIVPTNSKEQ